MRILDLSNNRLEGDVCGVLHNLPELQTLDLGGNRCLVCTSSRPWESTGLRHVDFGNTSIAGLPPWFYTSHGELRYLNLSNSYWESIPAELGNLASLEHLDFYNNSPNVNDIDSQLIPREMENLSNLRHLDLSLRERVIVETDYSGALPGELGNLANLEFLNVGNRLLTGPFPAQLGSLGKLEYLNSRGNQLSGEIPRELGDMTNLRVLQLGNNRFTGMLPSAS